MATNITSFIPEVAIPMCPKQTLKTAIADICRDFCLHTQLWNNQALTAIDVVAGTADYALSSASGDIVGIDAVLVDDNPAYPTTIEELDRQNRYWRETTETTPMRYIVGVSDSLKLVYTPSEAITAGLEVFVSLMPLTTATTVEDFLYRDYKKAIGWGAKGMLLDIPGMPWSDAKMAAYYTARYEAARDGAKILKFTGRTGKQLNALQGGAFFA